MSDSVVYSVVQPVNPDEGRTEYIVQWWGKPDFTFSLFGNEPRWISDSTSSRDIMKARERKRELLEFYAKVRIVERTVVTKVVE